MKIVFAGTPEFAAVALDALLRAGHDVRLVLTQPDRPAGRGLKPRASAVERLCDRAVLLRDGRLAFDGPVHETITRYRRALADEQGGVLWADVRRRAEAELRER